MRTVTGFRLGCWEKLHSTPELRRRLGPAYVLKLQAIPSLDGGDNGDELTHQLIGVVGNTMTCRLAADRAVLVDLHRFWSCRGGAVPDDSLFDEQTQGNNGDEDTRHFRIVRKRRVVRQRTEVTMGMKRFG